MLRYLTSGESHGRRLLAVLEGMPSGLTLSAAVIDVELGRRQGGYGRGARMRIESDKVEITSGVRFSKTLGSPIGLSIENLDWENWQEAMAAEGARKGTPLVTRPRPGHADLGGAMKYDLNDVRNVLERSSARETAARVGVGAVAKILLAEFGIGVYSWVVEIGGVRCDIASVGADPAKIFRAAEASVVRCPDRVVTEKMKRKIDRAKKQGDSLGGIFEVAAVGVPPGLGSHVQWDRKLDGLLARALMSIQAIKGVEVGIGFGAASTPGSKVHDEIFFRTATKGAAGKAPRKAAFWPACEGFYRKTNNAGGIEGGISNGEPVVLRAVMKPIPTLYSPLRSVDISSHKPFRASVERSDICAVPAAAVIAEAVVAFELARSFLDKFGGDSMREIRRNYKGYLKQISSGV